MRRGVIAVALICAFVVLAAYYQANITQHLDYPSESEVSANYAKYVGQNVTISGSVVATGVGSFQLNGMYGTYTILSSQAVQRGESVTLVGTLLPGHELRAVRCSCHHSCGVSSSTSARLLRSSFLSCSFS